MLDLLIYENILCDITRISTRTGIVYVFKTFLTFKMIFFKCLHTILPYIHDCDCSVSFIEVLKKCIRFIIFNYCGKNASFEKINLIATRLFMLIDEYIPNILTPYALLVSKINNLYI